MVRRSVGSRSASNRLCSCTRCVSKQIGRMGTPFLMASCSSALHDDDAKYFGPTSAMQTPAAWSLLRHSRLRSLPGADGLALPCSRLNEWMPCRSRKLAICHIRFSPRPPSALQYESTTKGLAAASGRMRSVAHPTPSRTWPWPPPAARAPPAGRRRAAARRPSRRRGSAAWVASCRAAPRQRGRRLVRRGRAACGTPLPPGGSACRGAACPAAVLARAARAVRRRPAERADERRARRTICSAVEAWPPEARVAALPLVTAAAPPVVPCLRGSFPSGEPCAFGTGR